MNEEANILSLEIKIDTDETAVETDQLTRNLLREIAQDIPTEAFGLKAHAVPEGARSAEAITIGVIVLTILPVFLDKLADLVISWAQRNKENKITLSILVNGGQITVEYNPKKTSLQEVKNMIKEAKQAIERKGK